MVIRFIIACLICLPACAADKFLRQGASGADDGSDWTDAWTSLATAEAGLSRGDVLYVADGSYSGDVTFNVATEGTTAITVKKATVASHGTETGWSDGYGDGQAIFDSWWNITSDYWIFDGGNIFPSSTGFKITCGNVAAAYKGSVDVLGQNIIFMGIDFRGDWSGAGIDTSALLYLVGDDITISNCWLYGSPAEDTFNIVMTGGSLTVERCRIDHTGHPEDGIHRDIANPYTGGTGGWNLYFRYNIIYGDMQNSGGGDGWLFQQPSKMGDIYCEYNVFSDCHRAVAFGSDNTGGGVVYIRNNTFFSSRDYTTTGTGPDGLVCSNNVYAGLITNGDYDNNNCGCPAPMYSAFTTDTGQFVAGTGNIPDATTSFINTASVDGADTIPFTADDGFNITVGSDLINSGISYSQTRDILNNAISGAPDVGAYEYVTSSSLLPIMNVGTVIQR